MQQAKEIQFFKEGTRFRLNHQKALISWLNRVARSEGFRIETLNYIFCNDIYLLELNKKFLEHNYFTDTITFSYAEKKGVIHGDIFISVETVTKNATLYSTKFSEELHRVMVHGLLHLCGYKDKSVRDQSLMRKMEDKYLSGRRF